jgi:hypothetical protein
MSPIDLIGLQQLEANASAMRTARKSPSSNERNLTERADVRGFVYNAIDARLWYNFARTKLLSHPRPPLCQSLSSCASAAPSPSKAGPWIFIGSEFIGLR